MPCKSDNPDALFVRPSGTQTDDSTAAVDVDATECDSGVEKRLPQTLERVAHLPKAVSALKRVLCGSKSHSPGWMDPVFTSDVVDISDALPLALRLALLLALWLVRRATTDTSLRWLLLSWPLPDTSAGCIGTRTASLAARLASPGSRSSPPLSAIAIWL
eukprot:2929220-Prymnesium_polylepis.1